MHFSLNVLVGFMAPELLVNYAGGNPEALVAGRVDYGDEPFKVDVFGLGVLAAICFTKMNPFESSNGNGRIMSNIQNDVWDKCTGVPWRSVSSSAKRLVRNMLMHDQAQRFSIEQVLANDWLVEHASAQS
jgi:serine/threonine protein kinase